MEKPVIIAVNFRIRKKVVDGMKEHLSGTRTSQSVFVEQAIVEKLESVRGSWTGGEVSMGSLPISEETLERGSQR